VYSRSRCGTPGVPPLKRCFVERFNRRATDSVIAGGADEIAIRFILSRNRACVGSSPFTQHFGYDGACITFRVPGSQVRRPPDGCPPTLV